MHHAWMAQWNINIRNIKDFVWFPPSSEKHAGWQIVYTKLPLGVNKCVCVWWKGVLSLGYSYIVPSVPWIGSDNEGEQKNKIYLHFLLLQLGTHLYLYAARVAIMNPNLHTVIFLCLWITGYAGLVLIKIGFVGCGEVGLNHNALLDLLTSKC